MLGMDLLIPFTMIGVGRYFLRSGGPKKINGTFGYRTAMSMRNEDTWRFAHTHCGRSWWIVGWALLPVSVAAMLFVLGKEETTVETVGGILSATQLVPLLASIFPTEVALRKRFDKEGNRK